MPPVAPTTAETRQMHGNVRGNRRTQPVPDAQADAASIQDAVDEAAQHDDPRRLLPPEAFDENASPRGGAVEVGILHEPDERFAMEKLILYPEAKEELQMAIELVMNRAALSEEWGFDEIEPLQGRCVVNLEGPSGTGKTRAVLTMARLFGKKVYQVDYSNVISKWVGDTAKHIKAAFTQAKQHDAILFFDEADSMMSKRISMQDGDGVSNSINQNRNVLMQELDRFDGIVFTATNFFANFDEALLRRIQQHITFKLPNRAMRILLFDLHIPTRAKARLAPDVNLETIAVAAQGMSGGDVKNACENAIKRAFMRSRQTSQPGQLTQDDFLTAVNAIFAAKRAHKQGRRPMLRTAAPAAVQEPTVPSDTLPATGEDHPTI